LASKTLILSLIWAYCSGPWGVFFVFLTLVRRPEKDGFVVVVDVEVEGEDDDDEDIGRRKFLFLNM